MMFQKFSTDKKMNIAKNLYFFSIKQHLGIAGVFSLLLLIAMPVSTLLSFLSQMQNENVKLTFRMEIPTMSLVYICTIMCVVLATMLYHYMHSKKATDMFHSLPIKRTSLLLVRYFAGLTILVVPVVVMSLLTWGIKLAFSSYSGDNSIQFFQVVIVILLAILGTFSFATFIAVNTGTVFDFLTTLFAINIAWPILINVLQQLFSSMLQGYSGQMSENVYSLFSPVAKMLFGASSYNDIFSYIYWPIFSFVMIVCALLLYKRRKSETVNSAFAYSYMHIFIKVVISVTLGISFAIGFSSAYVNKLPILIAMFVTGFIVGSFVAFIIVHVIVSRGFKGFRRSLITYGALMVAFVIFYCSLGFDVTRFSTRIMDKSDIISVETDYQYTNFEYRYKSDSRIFYGGYSKSTPITYSFFNSFNSNQRTNIYKDPKSIEAFYNLHANIIGQIKRNPYPYFSMGTNKLIGIEGNSQPEDYGYPSDHRSSNVYFNVKFHLKNGLSINRAYNIGTLTFSKELDNIQNLSEYKKFTSEAFRIEPDIFSSVNLTGEYHSQRRTDITPKQSKDIIMAYRADILESNINDPKYSLLGMVELNSNTYGTVRIPIYPSYKNLIQTLANESMDDVYKIPEGTIALLTNFIPVDQNVQNILNINFAQRLDLSFSLQNDINKIKVLQKANTKFTGGIMNNGFFTQYFFPDGTHSGLFYTSGEKTPIFMWQVNYKSYTSEQLAELGISG